MSRDEQERLRDIQDAIAAIRNHLEQAGETIAAKVLERDLPPLEHAIEDVLNKTRGA